MEVETKTWRTKKNKNPWIRSYPNSLYLLKNRPNNTRTKKINPIWKQQKTEYKQKSLTNEVEARLKKIKKTTVWLCTGKKRRKYIQIIWSNKCQNQHWKMYQKRIWWNKRGTPLTLNKTANYYFPPIYLNITRAKKWILILIRQWLTMDVNQI